VKHDLKLLLRNDLLSFAKKALREMKAKHMPEDRYLELLASRLAGVGGNRHCLERSVCTLI
jgi:hypothetical protein